MKKLKAIFTRRFKNSIYKTFAKCLLYLFLVCIAASIASCGCDDCTYTETKLSAYANKSGEAIKIIAIDEIYPTRFEEYIADGDTFYNYSFEERRIFFPIGCALAYCDDDRTVRVELHFLDAPQKCLIFDGPIKNDGIDMRSWDSYKRGNEVPDWAGFWAGIEYVYTITQEHKAMAKEEDCQSSAGE